VQGFVRRRKAKDGSSSVPTIILYVPVSGNMIACSSFRFPVSVHESTHAVSCVPTRLVSLLFVILTSVLLKQHKFTAAGMS